MSESWGNLPCLTTGLRLVLGGRRQFKDREGADSISH